MPLRVKNWDMYLMLLPAALLIAVFHLFPFVNGMRISLTNWDGFSPDFDFVGFANFREIGADPIFLIALKNMLIYGVACSLIQNVLGLAYALFVNQSFRLNHAVRLFVYLPSIIAGIIMGYMMYGMFQYNDGAINELLGLFGLERTDWLGSGNRAVFIIAGSFALQNIGVTMLIYLAGLQGIPHSLREAALVEGAGRWQMFRRITLPLLVPAMTTTFIIDTIGGLKMFDMIVTLTNGGPGNATYSLGFLVNHLYFWNQNAGQASAVGFVLVLIIFAVAYLLRAYFRSKEVEYL